MLLTLENTSTHESEGAFGLRFQSANRRRHVALLPSDAITKDECCDLGADMAPRSTRLIRRRPSEPA